MDFPTFGRLFVESWIDPGDGHATHDAQHVSVTNETGIPVRIVLSSRINDKVADRTYCAGSLVGQFGKKRRKWEIDRDYSGTSVTPPVDAKIDPIALNQGSIVVTGTAYSRSSMKNAHEAPIPITLNW